MIVQEKKIKVQKVPVDSPHFPSSDSEVNEVWRLRRSFDFGLALLAHPQAGLDLGPLTAWSCCRFTLFTPF